MPREPAADVAVRLREPLEHVSIVLLPVFFVITGLSVDIGGLSGTDYPELAAIVLVACAGKIVGVIVPARVLGRPWGESRALGLLMNTPETD